MSDHSHCQECNAVIDEDESYCDVHRPEPVPQKPYKPILSCNFCGKQQSEVKKLIAGPTVYICDECVALCQKIVNEVKS